ncbi:Protein translocase subunit secA [Harpegnathos saltator]|uniref:Protein translocase subunit secA n=1 Tax=Harpegnathos saltator TaxID=610380 RepID=E2C4L1_HARSA|nr:Protein translocase subunit secA [Harpegnathos saltator]
MFHERFSWEECMKDPKILKEFVRHIQLYGPLSPSYRELLAYIFNINICMYITNRNNQICLLDIHNPQSTNVMYLLYTNKNYTLLNINENFLRLDMERNSRANLCTKIIAEVESMERKADLDEYMKDRLFFPESKENTSEISTTKTEINEKLDMYNITIRHFSSSDEKQKLRFMLDKISSNSKITFKCYCMRYTNGGDTWRIFMTLLLLNSKLEQSKLNKAFSTECIRNILYLLSNISDRVPGLNELELSEWPYAIKEKYWTTKLSMLTKWQDEELQRACYYLLSLENSVGTSLVDEFMDFLIKKRVTLQSNKSTSLTRALSSFFQKKTGSITTDDFLQILTSFHNGEWNFSKNILITLNECQVDKRTFQMKEMFLTNGEDRNAERLIDLIKDDGNTSECILNDLNAIRGIIRAMKQVTATNEEAIKEEIAKHKSNIQLFNKKSDKLEYVHKYMADLLSLIDNVINMKKNFRLRDTQKLAILTLFRNECSTLMQISTGEGKSLIIAALSILKALCGQKVDIITSSSILAKRDSKINSDIYDLFSVSVSHNCDDDVENRKEVYSCKNVVYGQLSNFQRDYLLDRFYGKNILGDRSFDNVILDEVDSMLLDKGNNMLYLSHDLACLDKLESVYVHIWQQAVLYNMYGSLSKEDIKKIDSHISGQQINTIWERLIEYNIIDKDGYLLKDNVSERDIMKVLSPDFERYERYFIYMFEQISKHERPVVVPNYLKPFVHLHLDAWINNAKIALLMQERRDYIVDIDGKGSRPNVEDIIIIDRDTGTGQTNTQWDEALHQFLQLKHGCRLSTQSLKAVFVSNVRYLKLYNNLYGLTGTLGSQRERDLLREIYQVDFVTVPTTKLRKFKEYCPIVCPNPQEWHQQICSEADTYIKAGRSVLIICETVRDVESVYSKLYAKNIYINTMNLHTYTRDYESFDMATEYLCEGQIIIATNLAGRGTDIKITEQLDKAGGLHVCLTYIPNNNRVEQQAFGRTARYGNKCSGRLIILSSGSTKNAVLQTLHLKKERDIEEIHRTSDIKLYYETRTSVEEDAFHQFKEVYQQLAKNLKDEVCDEVKEILLRSCLDEWVFWLDENSKYINGTLGTQNTDKYKASLSILMDRLRALKSKESKNWVHWTCEPTEIVRLAKYFARNKQQDMAIELFDRVIKEEPNFSESAHYYKAFSLIKKIDKKDRGALKELKKELREAAKLLRKHRDYAVKVGDIIGTLRHRDPDIVQINIFKEQHKNISTIYQIFLQSIDDVLGHNVTSQSLEKYDINKELAETLYLDLIENNILRRPRISKNIKESMVKEICENHGIIPKELIDFLMKKRGSSIELQQFEKDMKKSVRMPNRKEFWKLLVKEKILKDEVKYVTIRVELISGKKAKSQSVSCEISIEEDEEDTKDWAQNNDYDVDLTVNKVLSNEKLQEQRREALNAAFKKCCDIVGKYKDAKRRSINLRLEDFKPTLYDTIYVDTPYEGKIGFFPVQMEAKLKVLVPEMEKQTETIKLEINIDNPCISEVKHEPKVPHVGYSVTGYGNLPLKVRGHILINKEGNDFLPHRNSSNIEVASLRAGETISDDQQVSILKMFAGPSDHEKILVGFDTQNFDHSRMRGKKFFITFY